jgi:hypothetical protein
MLTKGKRLLYTIRIETEQDNASQFATSGLEYSTTIRTATEVRFFKLEATKDQLDLEQLLLIGSKEADNAP